MVNHADKPTAGPTVKGSGARPKAILCNCQGTMPLDFGALARACKSHAIENATELCGTGLAQFRKEAKGATLTVACTQQAPLFQQIAEDEGFPAKLTFLNIRETAGWSNEATGATAKIAALLARSTLPIDPQAYVSLESEGVTLVLGRDERALDVASRLADALDITVLLTGEAEVTPLRTNEVPVRRGIAKTLKGHLGAYELTIDGYAEPAPSSRASYRFGPARNGLTSRADIVIDLTGRTPLISAPDLREGYLRADPDDTAAIDRILLEAPALVGTFDKPRYVAFKESLCAHSRSRITGCTRCLDVCPAGAITPNGDHVAIDPYVCGGCGGCSAVCPTGAATYAMPPIERRITEIRTLVSTYRAAGGANAVLLIHDAAHGTPLIDACARHGDGLPANVLPLSVNEVTSIGLETIASAFAYGVSHVRLLLRQKPRHDPAGLRDALAYAAPILATLGFGDGVAATIETDDPDIFASELRALPPATPANEPATFAAFGTGREILKLAIRELHRVAPVKAAAVALPARAPFGRVDVDTAGCTLCLSCVSACPTSALSAADDHPLLRFDETLCVQCGLCKATCPEKVIALEPRLGFEAWNAPPAVLKEEEPFCCISCGKAFGVKSTIDRILSRLEGKHWMYSGPNASRLDLVKMCDDCRVITVTNSGFDPYAAKERPLTRTTEDYFAERERQRKLRGEDPEGA